MIHNLLCPYFDINISVILNKAFKIFLHFNEESGTYIDGRKQFVPPFTKNRK